MGEKVLYNLPDIQQNLLRIIKRNDKDIDKITHYGTILFSCARQAIGCYTIEQHGNS